MDLQARFHTRFGRRARVFRAPGRVNLIGEHTDYNEGFVLPMAIGLHTDVAVAARDDRVLRVHSEQYGESRLLDLDALTPGAPPHWSDYVAGIAWVLQREGHGVSGADLLIDSDIPPGAGLSSSAALEVATAWALLSTNGSTVTPQRVAQLCQQAENAFVGVRCGIMDPFICACARAGHALLLDCRTLAHTQLPLPPSARIVVANTMVRHTLADGAYNERRADCEGGVRRIARRRPEVRTLRDATLADLETVRLPRRVMRRCRHVIGENQRVLDAAQALRRGDLDAFGACMRASHESLRDDYEVSCAELDLMVEIAGGVEGVHGTRMTGGGFGGCTVTLVQADRAAHLVEIVRRAYHARTGIAPDVYVCTAEAGARPLVGFNPAPDG